MQVSYLMRGYSNSLKVDRQSIAFSANRFAGSKIDFSNLNQYLALPGKQPYSQQAVSIETLLGLPTCYDMQRLTQLTGADICIWRKAQYANNLLKDFLVAGFVLKKSDILSNPSNQSVAYRMELAEPGVEKQNSSKNHLSLYWYQDHPQALYLNTQSQPLLDKVNRYLSQWDFHTRRNLKVDQGYEAQFPDRSFYLRLNDRRFPPPVSAKGSYQTVWQEGLNELTDVIKHFGYKQVIGYDVGFDISERRMETLLTLAALTKGNQKSQTPFKAVATLSFTASCPPLVCLSAATNQELQVFSGALAGVGFQSVDPQAGRSGIPMVWKKGAITVSLENARLAHGIFD